MQKWNIENNQTELTFIGQVIFSQWSHIEDVLSDDGFFRALLHVKCVLPNQTAFRTIVTRIVLNSFAFNLAMFQTSQVVFFCERYINQLFRFRSTSRLQWKPAKFQASVLFTASQCKVLSNKERHCHWQRVCWLNRLRDSSPKVYFLRLLKLVLLA